MLFRRLLLSACWIAMGCVLFSAGCGSKDSKAPSASITAEKEAPTTPVNVEPVSRESRTSTWQTPELRGPEPFPEVLIKTSLGEIVVRLDAEKAPITVSNFLDSYVKRGAYDGTIVHYVAQDSMVLAGGFDTKRKAIETRSGIFNEAGNGLKNLRGTIAMARDKADAYGAKSEFFFNLADHPKFDYRGADKPEDYGYCVFGKVIRGLDVLDRISRTPVHEFDGFAQTPVKPIVILSVKRLK